MAEYDAAYKRLFESARLVEDLLREALAEHPAFIDTIDFTTMRRLPGELITESLHKRFIDSVWEIEQIGQRSSVVVVLEFQSNVDADMGLRMLAYSSVLLQSLIGQESFPSTPRRSYPTCPSSCTTACRTGVRRVMSGSALMSSKTGCCAISPRSATCWWMRNSGSGSCRSAAPCSGR